MRMILSGFGTGGVKTLEIYEENKPILSRYEDCSAFFCEGESCLFGISELNPISKIYIYSKDGKELLDSRDINGGNLCHISYIKKTNMLVGACYMSGNIFWVKVLNNRFVGEVYYHYQGQTAGKAHCAVLNEDESILFSANIEQDRIYCYKPTESSLELISFLQLPIGIGPRHILPFGLNSYYVITEYSNEILLVIEGELKFRYSTLSEGYLDISYGSSLCISPINKDNKRFLYAANRGENTIAVFEVMTDYSLKNVGRFSCGDFPRHIALIENGDKIVSANQHGNCFSIFAIDKNTGLATKKLEDIPFIEPGFVM